MEWIINGALFAVGFILVAKVWANPRRAWALARIPAVWLARGVALLLILVPVGFTVAAAQKDPQMGTAIFWLSMLMLALWFIAKGSESRSSSHPSASPPRPDRE